MAEGEAPRIEYIRPIGREPRKVNGPDVHELRRNSIFGMISNLGPTQTAFDPDTGAEYNIDFKFTDPIRENPGGYILPGFYPQGDLISVVETVAALGLGAADGYGSRDEAEYKADLAYKRIVEGEGNFREAIMKAQIYENEMLEKISRERSCLLPLP